MFPKISDLINFISGSHIHLPVQTYGFFMVMGFIAGGLVLRAELQRKEKEGLLHARMVNDEPNRPASRLEFLSGMVVSTLIGWKFFGIIFSYHEFSPDPQGYIMSLKGNLLALVAIPVISASYYAYTHYRSEKFAISSSGKTIHPAQNTWNIMFVTIVSALAGSKLFDIIDNFGQFMNHPWHSLFSFSGFAFYGGFVVTVVVLIIYMKTIALNWKHVIDCSAPAILLGYAVGRMGCHLSGDGCWGIVNTMPQPHYLSWLPEWTWAWNFPHNVANQGIPIPGCTGEHCLVLAQAVFPTSLYESLISLLLFGVVWLMRKRIKAPVVLFGLFMVLNGTERFFIEKIRVNHRYKLAGLQFTQAEFISALLVISGLLLMFYFRKKYHADVTKNGIHEPIP